MARLIRRGSFESKTVFVRISPGAGDRRAEGVEPLFKQYKMPVDPALIRRALSRSMAVALLVCAGCDPVARCRERCVEAGADSFVTTGNFCHCSFELNGGAS